MKKRCLSIMLGLALMLGMLPGMSLKVMAADKEANTKTYGDVTFTKISNPTTGTRQADGINTNDTTGYGSNRLNSYAWAVSSRGDSIYIGTNRTIFGSSLNAVAEIMNSKFLPSERMGKAIELLTGGEVPVNLAEEDYIPQIIKFDIARNSTKVIYQPPTGIGDDGHLYYLDKDGEIIPDADVASETASFRSVVQFKGNMYFGSLGANMLQLVRLDENDNAEIVFQTLGLTSSLRAGCTYDDGNGETVYFGGQDTTYGPWRKYRQDHEDDSSMLPIVIRYLDPETAGTDHEDWSGLVADFNDFGKYAHASVYRSGGGNVWDLCSYNGKLYLIMAYDNGWAMFRGEKGGSDPNKFGWTWTEVVGDDGKYPLAMNEEVAEQNELYKKDYGCAEYARNLTGTGLLESAATPYVYNGKMYIGSFDNATAIQAQTVIKGLVKFQKLMNKENWKNLDFGPTLTQIYAPIYEVLSHPQHVWVMDEDENITPADGINELLDGTTNDYVWRFIEHDGKLYAGTFDSSTAFIYFLDYSKDRFVSLLEKKKDDLPKNLQQLLDGDFSEKLRSLLPDDKSGADGNSIWQKYVREPALNAAASVEAFLDDKVSVEQLLQNVTKLKEALRKFDKNDLTANDNTEDVATDSSIADDKYAKAREKIEWLLGFVDLEGLRYWAKARKLVKNADQGFDIFVTSDGSNWEKVVSDGLKDPYNYGARTFTILKDELYVGTANPYYGAQLWKITDRSIPDPETAPAVEETEEKAAAELKAAKKEAQAAMNLEIVVTQTGKKVNVKWNKSAAADGYDVFVQYCSKKFKKPAKTIKTNVKTKAVVKKINGKKINLKKQLKVYVAAYKMVNGQKVVLAKSSICHVVGVKNKKYSNVKSLKLKKKSYAVNVGQTKKISAKIKLVDKKKKHIPKSHGPKFRYRTSDSSIATVNKNGVIKGIKKGKCTIYVYAINGKMKMAKVTVN